MRNPPYMYPQPKQIGREEAKLAEEAKAKEKAKAKAAAKMKKQEEEEEELERQIREIEEAEAEREKKEAEMLAKRAVAMGAAAKANAGKVAENDRKLKKGEREMQRLEDERERKRAEAEAKAAGGKTEESADAKKSEGTEEEKNAPNSAAPTPASDDFEGPPLSKAVLTERRGKPAPLNLKPLITKPVEPPQPSAALISLKSARFLTVLNPAIYPPNISPPNPALNTAVTAKGKSFKYDEEFLLQFQKVFTEKPSMEFESQIKALIGDGDGGSARSGSTRTPGRMGSDSSQSSIRAPGASAAGTFVRRGWWNDSSSRSNIRATIPDIK
jgi:translation initiation factor 4G